MLIIIQIFLTKLISNASCSYLNTEVIDILTVSLTDSFILVNEWSNLLCHEKIYSPRWRFPGGPAVASVMANSWNPWWGDKEKLNRGKTQPSPSWLTLWLHFLSLSGIYTELSRDFHGCIDLNDSNSWSK